MTRWSGHFISQPDPHSLTRPEGLEHGPGIGTEHLDHAGGLVEFLDRLLHIAILDVSLDIDKKHIVPHSLVRGP